MSENASTSQGRPVVVMLSADGVAPPNNIGQIAEIAEVREATAETLAGALPGADVLFVWDIFSGALAAAWDAADALRWVHVAAAGVDKILFGSDWPHPEGLKDPISFVDELTDFSEEDVAKIMGGNLMKLMKVSAPANA